MPRQNRVTPYGALIAVPDRGMFWGNRGVLHNPEGRLVRYSRGRAWAICMLEFKGRRRQQWAPGRLTELFFLDEATALAAGHRPCGECRYRLTALGADAQLIGALRSAAPLPDGRLDALRVFTLRLLELAGDVGDQALQAFLASGYTRQNALEVVLGIGAYTMSTLANRRTGAPLDDPLRGFAWPA